MAKNLTSIIYEGHTDSNTHPGFSIDCVLITFHKGKIKVLLRDHDIDNCKALLGGFVYNDESADQAALRILSLYTGLTDNIYMRQLSLFSNPNRIVIRQNMEYAAMHASAKDDGKWLVRRFITMGYFALVKYSTIKDLIPKAHNLKWFDTKNLPQMYSDHENIVNTLFTVMETMMPVIPIGYELLPQQFTMTELRKLHEIFLNKKLDRRNFQRKMLATGNIIQSEQQTSSENTYNAPILYSFNTPDIEK